MWRVAFRDPYDRVANRQPNYVWHPTQARAQYWAQVFTQYGFSVAVEAFAAKPDNPLSRKTGGAPGWEDR